MQCTEKRVAFGQRPEKISSFKKKKSKAYASFAIFEFRRIAHWRILHSKIKQRRIISACILLSLHQRFYILIQAEWNLYFLPRIKVPCKRLKS